MRIYISPLHHSNVTVYPRTDARCRLEPTAPHAKWHEMSANGLLDLMFLSDDMHALTAAATRRAAHASSSAKRAAAAAPSSFAAFSAAPLLAGWRASVRALLGL